MQIYLNEAPSEHSCHFCEQNHLSSIVSVTNAPAFLGCTSKVEREDVFLSFHIYVCHRCGLIQTDATPLDATYADIHSEALGSIWQRHHQSLAQLIDATLPKDKPIHILELGASSQPIARRLCVSAKKVCYIDPITAAPFDLRPNEHYISGYFPAAFPETAVDLIIASHVVEHIPKTAQFFQSVLEQLTPKGIFVMSIPQFKTWFQKAYFNAISAEHIVYPFESQLLWLAETTNSKITIIPYEEHSLFAVFSKGKGPVPLLNNNSTFSANVALLIKWVSDFQKAVAIPSAQLTNEGPYFVTGASHLSQYFLLSNPIIKEKIVGVLDNSTRKWGQRVYGTTAKACPFEHISSFPKPTVFLTPSPYRDEMRKQMRNINPAAIIIDL